MRKYLTIVTLFVIALVYLQTFHPQQLAAALWLLLGLIVLAVVLALLFGGWYVAERLKMLRAKRIEAEKQAHVLPLTHHGQLWVRDTDHRATWHALHLEQRIYSNGQYHEPTEHERTTWQTFTGHRAKVIEGQTGPALLPSPVDLLATLDNAQRCLIVGASNAGKTTLLQHLVTRRLNRSKVIVIDPHAHPAKWPGCQVIGIGRDYQAVDEALQGLVRLMTQRYEEIGRGEVVEETHPRIIVVIDEWRAIVYNVKIAAQAIATLLTESRKAAFSVFVGTHSERVRALGIEGEGDLKDGFVIVRLSLIEGQRQASIDTGNGEHPAILPGPYAVPIQTTAPPVSVGLPVIEPDETEQRILELHQEGASLSQIAIDVYGSKGGKQAAQIKAILSKFEAI